MSSESDGSVVVSKEVVWEFETGDITWLEWHPGANVLFATTDGSELWMWKIPSGDSKVYLGNGEKAEGAVIMPGDFYLIFKSCCNLQQSQYPLSGCSGKNLCPLGSKFCTQVAWYVTTRDCEFYLKKDS